MSDVQQKKKHSEPQYLFAWNKSFASGYLDTPAHKKQIASTIAGRYHISSYSHIFSEKRNAGLGCVIGIAIVFIPFVLFCLFGAVVLLWLAVDSIISEQTMNFPALLMILFVAFPMMGSMGIAGIQWLRTELNYRPGEVRHLYNKLIKDGKIVVGEYTGKGISYPSTSNYELIQYQFEDEKGKIIMGEIAYLSGTTKHLVPGIPIYVVYLDEKLHAPL
mgnify:CR=1 FL=1